MEAAVTQEFLDNIRFPLTRILQWEFLCGPQFLSFGGEKRALETYQHLNLLNGHHYKILDIGSGMGGTEVALLKHFPDAHFEIIGVDPSKNITKLAQERLTVNGENAIKFITADIMEIEFEARSFDIIYSRDSIMYVKYKKELFQKLYNWLKPITGKLFITDYFEGENLYKDDKILNHYNTCGHTTISFERYLKNIELAGFMDIRSYYKSEELINYIQDEILFLEKNREKFCNQWNEDDYNEIFIEWTGELERFQKKGYESHWIEARRNT